MGDPGSERGCESSVSLLASLSLSLAVCEMSFLPASNFCGSVPLLAEHRERVGGWRAKEEVVRRMRVRQLAHRPGEVGVIITPILQRWKRRHGKVKTDLILEL